MCIFGIIYVLTNVNSLLFQHKFQCSWTCGPVLPSLQFPAELSYNYTVVVDCFFFFFLRDFGRFLIADFPQNLIELVLGCDWPIFE